METARWPAATADGEILAAVRRFVEEAAIALHGDADVVAELVLAVNEAVTNVLLHGYRGQPGLINIGVERRGHNLVVYLRDQAPPFDPTTVPPPDITLPLERRAIGGMGVHMMREFTDELQYRRTPAGENELIMVKRL